MKIVMTGASGFVGSKLVELLLADGNSLHALGRKDPHRPGVAFSQWEADASPPTAALEGANAVIHLAGTPISQRWNERVKNEIRASRVNGTRNLVEALAAARTKPAVLVSASAIGFYGDRGEQQLDEGSSPGDGFLADVCVEWERQARSAEGLGVRVVMPRLGVVLGKDGGALKSMLPAFKLAAGGTMGDGKQWMSWIHIDDLLALLQFALAEKALDGPVNAVAPQPVRNSHFTKALGEALGRPTLLLIPKFALGLMFGEMAQVVLASQNVSAAKAQRAGFRFRFPAIEAALHEAVE
jgi:uncharacterized protein (TIGR01777 family)